MTESASGPLHGLVLAGGSSKRMGRDKAALLIDGQPALARAFDLLQPHCQDCFVSVSQQQNDSLRADFPQLVDRFGSVGPADGIGSAHLSDPSAAWLVVACDLPLLDDQTLRYLLANRDVKAEATAFRSTNDGLPEPLCAIYEPTGGAAVVRQLNDDLRCPRKMLLQMHTHLLDQPNRRALDNTNTPEDWRQVVGE